MSLPPAPKDVSSHPKKGSVVSPVDREAKNKDVDRNIRFYTILTALREGKLPSNAQISTALRRLLDGALSQSPSTSPMPALSPAGKTLVTDSRQIIDTLRLIIDEKNADELIQDFVFGLYGVHPQGLKDTLVGVQDDVPLTSQRDAGDPVEHLRTLLKLLLSNAEVRKLFTDFSTIGRDLLARTAGAAAKRVAPHPDALSNVDRPAEGDAFVEGQGEVQDSVREKMNKARDAVGNVSDDEIADTARGGRDEAKAAASDVTGRFSEQHRETVERGKRFLSEEYFPKERRDQFIFRGKKVILELQNHEDYQSSIRWLISYIEDYIQHSRATVDKHGPKVGEHVKRSNLTTSLSQLRTILERFANNLSMDGIFDAIDGLVDDARRDEALWTWWTSVGLWIRKVLLEPGYVINDDCTTHATRLRDLGREFYEGKYKDHFDGLFDSVGKWVGGVGDDPVNKQFAGDWARFTKDLLFDSEGSLKFKPELWDDIRRVVVPGIIDQVGYIPIPRIEYTDDTLDLIIENLTLQGRNLFPNLISFDVNNYIRFSPYNSMGDDMTNRHRVKIHLEQMQADMRDVAFYYRKKKGIPKMKDSGVADVVIGGRGLSVLIDLVSSPPNDPTSLFHIHSISVKLDVHSLKFAIRDSNHDFLYKTLHPLATGLIKRQIEKAVREGVSVGLMYLDGQLIGVRERMKSMKTEGKEQVQGEGEGVLRDIYKRGRNANANAGAGASAGEAANAAKEHAGEATDTLSRQTHVSTTSRSSRRSSSSTSPTKAKARNSQFRLVGDKRHSLFADQPGVRDSVNVGAGVGWLGRVEQKEGMIGTSGGKKQGEGEGWKSDVFQFAN